MDILCQNNPFLIVLIEDLNAKSKNWYCHDKSSHEGNAIENVTAQFGLQQIINEPTHISNTSSSCIDLIFMSQPNLVTDPGVHSSLHPNCHHQIVFAKLNLHIVYPPPYLREIWHYREANTEANTDLLDEPSKNLIGKEHFRTQALMKKLIFLIELFLIFLVTLFHMK